MLWAIILGSVLGILGGNIVKLVYIKKKAPYASYIRFFSIITISVIGPGFIYILRLFEGSGEDGDFSLQVAIIFGISALSWLFPLIYIFDKKYNKS